MFASVLLILTLRLITGQSYTQWTGYGNFSDLLQLPSDTEFRIRHIGGKYLYQNIGSGNTGEYYIYGRCDLDSTYAPISYWTVSAQAPADPPIVRNISYTFSNCWPDITSYIFTSTQLTAIPNRHSQLSVCGWNNFEWLYTEPACGNRYWLPTDCDGDLKVITVYNSLIYPRYYTHLRVMHNPNLDPSVPFDVNDYRYYCPRIDDTCYDPLEDIVVTHQCGLNNYQNSLWTFEVNAPPDMTINDGLGPTKYYEGYSHLSDLSDGDVVVIRLISGM